MQGKRVLIGISGGIAAYKIAFLVRLLKKQGAEVRCIMTPASSDFITPLTLSTLSGNPVVTDYFDPVSGAWHNHVEYGLWADIFVIAPLTANTLAKMAHGFSDNFLLTTYLSSRAKVLVAPAMDLDMYVHPTTKRNLAQLEADGVTIIPAESGELASGLHGEGRMAEPETIVAAISHELSKNGPLKAKKILITAGPTYEAIDPVRFIGNHSSGKMGFALARAAAGLGAEVTLVSGPSNLSISNPAVKLIRVESATEMMSAVSEAWKEQDWGIFSAAVADYRPKDVASEKIKKSADGLTIELVKNPDILQWCGEHKTASQKVIGFALETKDGLSYAQEKLVRKNADAIVLNQIGARGVGIGYDTNEVSVVMKNNKIVRFELQSKDELAEALIQSLLTEL